MRRADRVREAGPAFPWPALSWPAPPGPVSPRRRGRPPSSGTARAARNPIRACRSGSDPSQVARSGSDLSQAWRSGSDLFQAWQSGSGWLRVLRSGGRRFARAPDALVASSRSQDLRPVPEGARRFLSSADRVRGPRSKPTLPSAEPSSARRGPSLRKVRVLGPVPRVPAPNGRPAGRVPSRAAAADRVRRAPSAAGGRRYGALRRRWRHRVPSAADGRAVRRAPSLAGGRAVRRAPSAAADERYGGFRRPRTDERYGARPRLLVDARRQVSGGHAGRRRPSRHRGPRRRDRCGARARRVQRPSGPDCNSWSRWSRPAADSFSGSSPLRRWHGPSSGYCGHRRYDRRRLPLGPWAFRVPQPLQPTSSICHHRTRTNEEGRSTSSGATLFTYVRQCPTLPRGPPRSTIGAEELNFRVRNGTGCFPFAITAETLLRCHRPEGLNSDRISGTAQWTQSKNME